MNEWFCLGHLSLRRKWKCLLIEDKFEWKWKFFPPKCWDLLLMWKYQRIKVKVNVSEEMGFVACVQTRQLLSICLCEDTSLPFLFYQSLVCLHNFIQEWKYTCLLMKDPYSSNYFWIFIFGQVELFLTLFLGFTSSSLQPLIFGKTVFLTATLSCAWMSLKYSGKRWNRWDSL